MNEDIEDLAFMVNLVICSLFCWVESCKVNVEAPGSRGVDLWNSYIWWGIDAFYVSCGSGLSGKGRGHKMLKVLWLPLAVNPCSRSHERMSYSERMLWLQIVVKSLWLCFVVDWAFLQCLRRLKACRFWWIVIVHSIVWMKFDFYHVPIKDL